MCYFSALGRAVWDETNLGHALPSSALHFSALGRAVWDETEGQRTYHTFQDTISVLSVEPYGMKLLSGQRLSVNFLNFSALGRAVWDETRGFRPARAGCGHFSALGRAVWDETSAREQNVI